MVRAACRYEGQLRPAIHRFKYAGRKSLNQTLGMLMGYAWQLYPELRPVDAILPIPLHPRTARERGYNQAGLLASTLIPILDRPILDSLLVRVRRTTPQFNLRKTDRLNNLNGAFGLAPGHPSIKGLRLLLVDDVCTTGATLKECARALRRAGAASVKALVLARDI
jgi:ComF family protein